MVWVEVLVQRVASHPAHVICDYLQLVGMPTVACMWSHLPFFFLGVGGGAGM